MKWKKEISNTSKIDAKPIIIIINCNFSLDIITKSTDLSYCLDFNWGADTLSVNGCFQVDSYKRYRKFRRFFAITTYNNYGLGMFDLVKVLFQRYNPLDSD